MSLPREGHTKARTYHKQRRNYRDHGNVIAVQPICRLACSVRLQRPRRFRSLYMPSYCTHHIASISERKTTQKSYAFLQFAWQFLLIAAVRLHRLRLTNGQVFPPPLPPSSPDPPCHYARPFIITLGPERGVCVWFPVHMTGRSFGVASPPRCWLPLIIVTFPPVRWFVSGAAEDADLRRGRGPLGLRVIIMPLDWDALFFPPFSLVYSLCTDLEATDRSGENSRSCRCWDESNLFDHILRLIVPTGSRSEVLPDMMPFPNDSKL